MTNLEEHYNKFNEDKRLLRRHGNVEYVTTLQYIHESLERLKNEGSGAIRIIDVGAGTGRYSVVLAEEGYDVTAVELVKHNLGLLKAKNANVKAYQGNALRLKRFANDSFDLTLLFGPMYHLYTAEDKLKALNEAARITRPGGIIMVAYLMNEYGVLTYGFKEGHVLECLEDGRLDENFKCHSEEKDLYDYMRLEDISELNQRSGLTRIKIIAADGPANYMRTELNAMSDEVYEAFIRYHLSVCERMELMGATAHTVDILRK